MLPRAAPPLVLLLAACEAPGRRAAEVPVALGGVGTELSLGGAGTLRMEEARVTLGELELRSRREDLARRGWRGEDAVLDLLLPVARAHPGHDPGTDVVGEVAGQVTLDLLAGGPIGVATVYEGPVETCDLALAAVTLRGTVSGDGGTRTLDVDLPVEGHVIGVILGASVSASAPPRGWTLALDLPAVLGAVVSVVGDSESTWTFTDPAARNTLSFYLRDHELWSLSEVP